MHDRTALVPSTIEVVFPKTDGDGNPIAGDYAVDVSLASLSLTDYGTTTGHSAKRLLRSTAVAVYSGVTLTNGAELAAMASQMAKDWYLWRLAFVDETFSGVAPWDMEGMHAVEWWHGDGRIATRVTVDQREGGENVGGLQASTDGGSVSNFFTGVNVLFQSIYASNVTITESLNVWNSTVTITNSTVVFQTTTVNVYDSFFNFSTTTINITGDSYFLIGGDTTIIIGDPIYWGKPKVAQLVTNVCLTKKTFQVVLGTQTEVPDATWVDLISTTFSLEKTTAVLVWGVVGFDCATAGVADDNFHADLQVDGASETTLIKFRPSGTNSYDQPTQVWKLNLVAGSHTLKLRAKRFDGSGTVFATVDTTLTVHADDVLTVEKSTYALPNGTFLVSQACEDASVCCESTGSGGTGSTPGDTIQTDCCERPICETLTATITGDIVGTGTLLYSGSLWEGDILTSAGQTLTVMVSCVWRDPDWVWRVETSGCYASAFEGAGLTSVQCEPTLELVVPETTGQGCGDTGVEVTYVLTITEDADCTDGGGDTSCCGGEASMPATLYGSMLGLEAACPDAVAGMHNITMTGELAPALPTDRWTYSGPQYTCPDFTIGQVQIACFVPPGETLPRWIATISSGFGSPSSSAYEAISDDAVCDHPEFGGFYATFTGFKKSFTGDDAPYPITLIVRKDPW